MLHIYPEIHFLPARMDQGSSKDLRYRGRLRLGLLAAFGPS